MSNPTGQLPEYWKASFRRPRHRRDWQNTRTVIALGVAASALVFSGAMLIGIGSTTIGRCAILAAAAVLVWAVAVENVRS
jgi:anti-sigma factor RsiW